MNDVDIGSIGETEFSLICRKAGFATTITNQDKNGWDYIVECPQKSIFRSSSLSPKCLVQVKASTVGNTRWEISLKNALSLASWQGPSFIALMLYGKDQNLKKILILHFDKNALKRIYQRLSKEYEKDIFVEIHQKTISFDLRSERSFEKDIPNSLRDYFEETFSRNSNQYIINKIDLINAFFEKHIKPYEYVEIFGSSEIQLFARSSDGKNAPNIKISGLNNLRHFLDFYLGYKENLPEHTNSLIQDMVETSSPVVKANIKPRQCIVSHGVDEDVEVGWFDFYTTATIAGLPTEFHISRLKSKFLDIVIGKNTTRFTVHTTLPHPDEYVDIDELSRSIHLFEKLARFKDNYAIHIQENENTPKIRFDLKLTKSKVRAWPEEWSKKIFNAAFAFNSLQIKERTSFHLVSQCDLAIFLINIYYGNMAYISSIYFEIRIKDQGKIDQLKPLYVLQPSVLVVSPSLYFRCSFVFKDCELEERIDGEYVVSRSLGILKFRQEKVQGLYNREEYEQWYKREVELYDAEFGDSTLVVAEI